MMYSTTYCIIPSSSSVVGALDKQDTDVCVVGLFRCQSLLLLLYLMYCRCTQYRVCAVAYRNRVFGMGSPLYSLTGKSELQKTGVLVKPD